MAEPPSAAPSEVASERDMLLTIKLHIPGHGWAAILDVAIRYILVMMTGLSSGVEDHWKR